MSSLSKGKMRIVEKLKSSRRSDPKVHSGSSPLHQKLNKAQKVSSQNSRKREVRRELHEIIKKYSFLDKRHTNTSFLVNSQQTAGYTSLGVGGQGRVDRASKPSKVNSFGSKQSERSKLAYTHKKSNRSEDRAFKRRAGIKQNLGKLISSSGGSVNQRKEKRRVKNVQTHRAGMGVNFLRNGIQRRGIEETSKAQVYNNAPIRPRHQYNQGSISFTSKYKSQIKETRKTPRSKRASKNKRKKKLLLVIDVEDEQEAKKALHRLQKITSIGSITPIQQTTNTNSLLTRSTNLRIKHQSFLSDTDNNPAKRHKKSYEMSFKGSITNQSTPRTTSFMIRGQGSNLKPSHQQTNKGSRPHQNQHKTSKESSRTIIQRPGTLRNSAFKTHPKRHSGGVKSLKSGQKTSKKRTVGPSNSQNIKKQVFRSSNDSAGAGKQQDNNRLSHRIVGAKFSQKGSLRLSGKDFGVESPKMSQGNSPKYKPVLYRLKNKSSTAVSSQKGKKRSPPKRVAANLQAVKEQIGGQKRRLNASLKGKGGQAHQLHRLSKQRQKNRKVYSTNQSQTPPPKKKVIINQRTRKISEARNSKNIKSAKNHVNNGNPNPSTGLRGSSQSTNPRPKAKMTAILKAETREMGASRGQIKPIPKSSVQEQILKLKENSPLPDRIRQKVERLNKPGEKQVPTVAKTRQLSLPKPSKLFVERDNEAGGAGSVVDKSTSKASKSKRRSRLDSRDEARGQNVAKMSRPASLKQKAARNRIKMCSEKKLQTVSPARSGNSVPQRSRKYLSNKKAKTHTKEENNINRPSLTDGKILIDEIKAARQSDSDPHTLQAFHDQNLLNGEPDGDFGDKNSSKSRPDLKYPSGVYSHPQPNKEVLAVVGETSNTPSHSRVQEEPKKSILKPEKVKNEFEDMRPSKGNETLSESIIITHEEQGKKLSAILGDYFSESAEIDQKRKMVTSSNKEEDQRVIIKAEKLKLSDTLFDSELACYEGSNPASNRQTLQGKKRRPGRKLTVDLSSERHREGYHTASQSNADEYGPQGGAGMAASSYHRNRQNHPKSDSEHFLGGNHEPSSSKPVSISQKNPSVSVQVESDKTPKSSQNRQNHQQISQNGHTVTPQDPSTPLQPHPDPKTSPNSHNQPPPQIPKISKERQLKLIYKYESESIMQEDYEVFKDNDFKREKLMKELQDSMSNSFYYLSSLHRALSTKQKDDPFYLHFKYTLRSMEYIQTLEPLPEDDFLEKKVYLPPKRNPKLKTLILDLDETLVHCDEDITQPYDLLVPIKFTGGDVVQCGVSIRPFAKEFLKNMSLFFEIVIFTASHSCYANKILGLLDPDNKYIVYRLFRESCIETEEGIYIKDLRIFANRKLDELIIVDNAFFSYGFQIDNGVPIVPFMTDKGDTQLRELTEFLVGIKDEVSVTHFLRRYFLSEIFIKYLDKPQILEEVVVKCIKEMGALSTVN